jgi:RNA recognition motif-containing protein
MKTNFVFDWNATDYYKAVGEFRRNIFIGGLTPSIDCTDLVSHFETYGEVWHAHIV